MSVFKVTNYFRLDESADDITGRFLFLNQDPSEKHRHLHHHPPTITASSPDCHPINDDDQKCPFPHSHTPVVSQQIRNAFKHSFLTVPNCINLLILICLFVCFAVCPYSCILTKSIVKVQAVSKRMKNKTYKIITSHHIGNILYIRAALC